VYSAAQEAEKEDFLVDLVKMCSDQSLPLLIGGDFNLIRSSTNNNNNNRNFKCTKWFDMFNQIINTYELREIIMSSGQFFWSNKKVILPWRNWTDF
jgi:hypothetical protein